MCGRFTIAIAVGWQERFQLKEQPFPLPLRFNIAPTQYVPIIVSESPNRAVMMQWGLIPSWAKDSKIGAKLINARAETLHERPAFRAPLKSKRCLVPATGFYEWKKTAMARIPYYIHRKDNALFAFAGLYDVWRSPETTENLFTFTIITTEPNALVTAIHNRMPAIIKQEHESLWLQHESLPLDEVREILNPYPADQLEAYRVSTAVNNPNLDSEELIRPLR